MKADVFVFFSSFLRSAFGPTLVPGVSCFWNNKMVAPFDGAPSHLTIFIILGFGVLYCLLDISSPFSPTDKILYVKINRIEVKKCQRNQAGTQCPRMGPRLKKIHQWKSMWDWNGYDILDLKWVNSKWGLGNMSNHPWRFIWLSCPLLRASVFYSLLVLLVLALVVLAVILLGAASKLKSAKTSEFVQM